MAEFIIGRLFGWQDFSNDGDDVWIIHISDPVFIMRIIHRPDNTLPNGELADFYFPLETDNNFALGNLTFLEPRQADPRIIAELISQFNISPQGKFLFVTEASAFGLGDTATDASAFGLGATGVDGTNAPNERLYKEKKNCPPKKFAG